VLFLLCQLGSDRYALEAARITEVLPLVGLKKILRAPPGIAGMLNYHGDFVPVIDLSELALGRSAPSRLGTRIILVRLLEEGDKFYHLGIIAENATEMMRCDPADFVSPGIVSGEAPYLGAISIGTHGVVQRVDIDRLLTPSLRDLLLKQPVHAS
jgi:chemotaxis-related protein WspB